MNKNKKWMIEAIKEAKNALLIGEVPIGAVIVKNDQVIARSFNSVIQQSDPTAHAETNAIRAAGQFLSTEFLDDCDLYVTLEPCLMCIGAISLSRMRRIYFGSYSPKFGAIDHGPRALQYCQHKPEVYGGILESETTKLLSSFFQDKR